VFTRSGDAAAPLSILALLLDPHQRVFGSSSLQVFNVEEDFIIHGGSWATADLLLPPPYQKTAVANGITQCAVESGRTLQCRSAHRPAVELTLQSSALSAPGTSG
jgi:hypothetical protein